MLLSLVSLLVAGALRVCVRGLRVIPGFHSLRRTGSRKPIRNVEISPSHRFVEATRPDCFHATTRQTMLKGPRRLKIMWLRPASEFQDLAKLFDDGAWGSGWFLLILLGMIVADAMVEFLHEPVGCRTQ